MIGYSVVKELERSSCFVLSLTNWRISRINGEVKIKKFLVSMFLSSGGEAAKTKKAPTTPVSRRNERIKKDPMISLTESDSYYSIERAN